MLPWKKDSVDISHDMPTFHVRYLGTTETFISNGKGCTTQPLQRLWDNAPSEKNLRKVTIAFSVSGIYMNELESKHGEERSTKSFNMEDISFCSADKSVNDRLFCWISKNPLTGKLEAHAVLCSTCEKAQSMSSVLSRAFQLAYKDWTADKQRQKRRKSTISVTLLDASSESGPVSPPHGRFVSSTRRSSDHSVSIVPPAEDYKNRRKLSD